MNSWVTSQGPPSTIWSGSARAMAAATTPDRARASVCRVVSPSGCTSSRHPEQEMVHVDGCGSRAAQIESGEDFGQRHGAGFRPDGDEVCDLASQAAVSPDHVTVDHHGATKPFAEVEVDEVVQRFGTGVVFGSCGPVDVVVDEERAGDERGRDEAMAYLMRATAPRRRPGRGHERCHHRSGVPRQRAMARPCPRSIVRHPRREGRRLRVVARRPDPLRRPGHRPEGLGKRHVHPRRAWCPRNEAYAASVRQAFLTGSSPTDFPGEHYERDWTDRFHVVQLDQAGRRGLGLD